MGIVSIALLVIFVIGAIIMILVILLQDDQGEGLAGMFGGGGTTPVGSRSGNLLTRFTSILAAIFIVGAFALAWINRTPGSADILERARLQRLQAVESQDWWVERLEDPALGTSAESADQALPGPSAAEAAGQAPTAAQGEVPPAVPESINR